MDDTGATYVARSQTRQVEVYPPGASGVTRPARVLDLDGVPRSLAVGPGGSLLVSVIARGTRAGAAQGNAIESFAPGAAGAAGAAVPRRVLSGPRALLGRATNIVSAEQLVVAYSPLTRRVYAAVSGGPAAPEQGVSAEVTHVSVFPEDVAGDSSAVRSITGSGTGLSGATLTGIAADSASGDIWVMASTGAFGTGTGSLLAFGRYADGNTTALRRITDPDTHFADVQGITVIKQ